MIVFTVVCRHCCAGWEVDRDGSFSCQMCGRLGEVRGWYRSIPLP